MGEGCREREERAWGDPNPDAPTPTPPTQALSAAARADKEEWVSAIGAALGDFGGAFDVTAAARARRTTTGRTPSAAR